MQTELDARRVVMKKLREDHESVKIFIKTAPNREPTLEQREQGIVEWARNIIDQLFEEGKIDYPSQAFHIYTEGDVDHTRVNAVFRTADHTIGIKSWEHHVGNVIRSVIDPFDGDDEHHGMLTVSQPELVNTLSQLYRGHINSMGLTFPDPADMIVPPRSGPPAP